MEVLDLTTSPSPEPANPLPSAGRSRLPGKPVVALLSFLSASILIAVAFFFFQSVFGPSGKIEVASVLGAAEVKINDQKVGSTPYMGEFRPGEYKIEVTDTQAEASWQGRVRLESGTLTSVTRDLGPSPDFSGGVNLSLVRGSGIEVAATPTGAEVSLDGTSIGQAPLNRPSPSPGTHKIKISAAGYVTKEFEISVTSGWKVVVDAALYKNPDNGVAVVEEAAITPTTVPDLEILINRENSGLNKFTPKTSTPSYTPWSRAVFYDLGTSVKELSADVSAWLKGFYFYALAHLRLPDFPFHFVIDSKGEIYEARSGGRDITSLDVASGLSTAAQTPTLKPGLVQVAYLGEKGGPTLSAKESFRKLVTWLGTPAKSAGTGKAEAVVSLKAGEEYPLAVSYKNTGWATWDNFNTGRVLLTVSSASVFYNSASWIDSTHPATSEETFIPRGSEANFKAALRAPAYGGDYDLVFTLTRSGALVEGSSFPVKVHVDGPAKPTQQVRIKATPTGFLRVRSGPGTGFAEIARVNPGETYEWTAEQSGWIQIKLSSGTLGWVSTTYVTKI